MPSAGRCGKRSLTAMGSSAPHAPIPMPTGSVSASSVAALGAAARSPPATAIIARTLRLTISGKITSDGLSRASGSAIA